MQKWFEGREEYLLISAPEAVNTYFLSFQDFFLCVFLTATLYNQLMSQFIDFPAPFKSSLNFAFITSLIVLQMVQNYDELRWESQLKLLFSEIGLYYGKSLEVWLT